MTTSVAHFYINGNEVFTADNDNFIYYKDKMLKRIAKKNGCSVSEIKVEVKEYDRDEYEIVTCEYCLRAGIYKYESEKTEKRFNCISTLWKSETEVNPRNST